MLTIYQNLTIKIHVNYQNLIKIHANNTTVVLILKTWVHPTMNCLTKAVTIYGNGVRITTPGYSQFMQIQNIIY